MEGGKWEPVWGAMTGHDGNASSVAMSVNGKLVLSGSFDKTVRVWEVESGKQVGGALTGLRLYVRNVAMSADGI